MNKNIENRFVRTYIRFKIGGLRGSVIGDDVLNEYTLDLKTSNAFVISVCTIVLEKHTFDLKIQVGEGYPFLGEVS